MARLKIFDDDDVSTPLSEFFRKPSSEPRFQNVLQNHCRKIFAHNSKPLNALRLDLLKWPKIAASSFIPIC
jgi:hypothetical protein